MIFPFRRWILFQADIDFMHGGIIFIGELVRIGIIGVIFYLSIFYLRVVYFYGNAEIIVVNDGNRLSVRQYGQAFGFFNIPAVIAQI